MAIMSYFMYASTLYNPLPQFLVLNRKNVLKDKFVSKWNANFVTCFSFSWPSWEVATHSVRWRKLPRTPSRGGQIARSTSTNSCEVFFS